MGAHQLRMVVLAAMVGSAMIQAQEREKCMVNFLDGCKLHSSYNGLADDSAAAYDHMGVVC